MGTPLEVAAEAGMSDERSGEAGFCWSDCIRLISISSFLVSPNI